MNALPETMMEAVQYFGIEQNAHDFVVGMRWPESVCCPRCGSVKVQYISTRKTWRCKDCIEKRTFTAKTGTVFEDSPLSLGKWLIAVWLLVNAKNGISSYELHRALGVTQKTAWFMLQRVRLAMQGGSIEKRDIEGAVEVDETFIGGRARNMHAGKRKAKGRGSVGKAVVLGMLQRNGEARVMVVGNTKRSTLAPKVRENVKPGAGVFTDALASYAGLEADYAHQVVDHAECYVKGNVHTNGLENFWSLLKRSIKGTYIAVEPFHLFRYLDEQSFRFNNRKDTDSGRFLRVVGGTEGKRLTYTQLIGDGADTEGCSA
jgi:transposase-like protein